MGNQTYLIGKVARLAGVTIDSVRYYERRGLLMPTARRDSGYREFDDEAVRRIRFIKRAQDIGFTLKEINELLFLASDEEATCSDIRILTLGKLNDIQRKIESLTGLRDVLSELVESCIDDGPRTQCPILESLADESSPDNIETEGAQNA